jgi:predicted nucleic acid-binding protein
MPDSSILLFDTGCLIDIYHGRERIRPYFETIGIGGKRYYLSALTEAKLWRGLRIGELARHETLISHFTVLPLRSEGARLAGSWMQSYFSTGLGWMDALIVATAQIAGIPVLTRDKRLAALLAEEADFVVYD